MSLFDDLSDSIFSQDSIRGFHIAGILFILLTIRAIVKLKKIGLIIKFVTEPKTIGQLILIGVWCFLVWHYVRKNKRSKDKKILDNVGKLQNATKKALLALIIAFFASIDLVIAPFWLIWVIAYYLEDWV
jgi:hypothetical protein